MSGVRATSRAVRRTFVKVPDKITGPTRVKVGFVKGKTDSDVIDRAIWNEFGTKGSGKGFRTAKGGGFGGPIPERPFMRNAARQMSKKYREQLTRAAKAIVEGRTTMKQVLEKLGVQAVGDIQREITSLSSPPNSPVTIALKGSSNPLIDTGEMRQAVTYKVDK